MERHPAPPTLSSLRATRRVLAILSAGVVLAATLAVTAPTPAAAALTAVITSPDTTGFVGVYPSLQIDATGNPVVSYYDETNGDLKVLHCNDPACAPGGDSTTSPDTAGDVGRYSSLQIDAAGNPVISYYDATNADLKVLHCNDPACAPGGESTTSPDTADGVGGYTSLQLDAAGNPVMSYYDGTNGNLKVLHCTNPTCTGTQISTSPDTAGDVGGYTSLQLDAAGNPVISYHDVTNADLKVLHCDDPDCAPEPGPFPTFFFDTPTSPDTTGNVGADTSLQLDSVGNPVISYSSDGSTVPFFPNRDLKVLHCTNPTCGGPQLPTRPTRPNGTEEEVSGEDDRYTSLQLDASGNPVIAYHDDSSGDLKVLYCDDPACDGAEAPENPDTAGDVGPYPSLKLDDRGNPVIAYLDVTNGDLRILSYADPAAAGVTADVTIGATPGVCVTLDTVRVDFGVLALGATGTAGPTTVTNCGSENISLAAEVSRALRSGLAIWSPTRLTTDVCTRGPDLFAYLLDDGNETTQLGDFPDGLNGPFLTPNGGTRTDTHTLYMPCPGSNGIANDTITMNVLYTATLT